jgi:hypothetical protein
MTKQTLIDDDELERFRRLVDRCAVLEQEIAHVRMERDRANLAFAELHSSHRALTIARDENGARFIELRDRIWQLEAFIRGLPKRVETELGGKRPSPPHKHWITDSMTTWMMNEVDLDPGEVKT